MEKIRFVLNTRKMQQYAYFDAISGLHLTLGNPLGSIPAEFFNPGLMNALKNGTIIDIDNAIDFKKEAPKCYEKSEDTQETSEDKKETKTKDKSKAKKETEGK